MHTPTVGRVVPQLHGAAGGEQCKQKEDGLLAVPTLSFRIGFVTGARLTGATAPGLEGGRLLRINTEGGKQPVLYQRHNP